MNGERPAAVLELNEASVMRGGTLVIDRMSLTLHHGEHTAIIGPNGSGKSTLIQLLTGQVYPLARPDGPPPVRVLGRDRWDLTELRSRLGIITSDLHMRFVGGSSMGRVTGIEAVLAGFFSSEVLFFHHEVNATMRDRAEAALARVGALHLRDRKMNQMSTGEARRVIIARALVHDPAVLVLDEPTTGLDLVARDDFLAQLRRLTLEGATLIIVTHHVEEVIPEIERVVLLGNGRIVANGTPDETLTSDRLAEAFGASVSLTRGAAGYELRMASTGQSLEWENRK
jgi:iron complex transport system ATP-binding protein